MPAPEGPILLLTRPEAASHRFAATIRAAFAGELAIVVTPTMEIVFADAEIPPAKGLIFSSQNALEAYLAQDRPEGRAAWCVGARTAEKLRAAGFDLRGWAETAERLLQVILTAKKPGPLLHLRGDQIAFPLADALNQAGIETNQVVLYSQRPLALTAEAQAALASGRDVVVPLFSPQTARNFLSQLAQPATARLVFVAISPAVARICAAAGIGSVVTAHAPDAAAMQSAVLRQLAALKPG